MIVYINVKLFNRQPVIPLDTLYYQATFILCRGRPLSLSYYLAQLLLRGRDYSAQSLRTSCPLATLVHPCTSSMCSALRVIASQCLKLLPAILSNPEVPIITSPSHNKKGHPLGDLCLLYGGEAGIRTLGTARFNGFQDRRFRPLSHLSRNFVYVCKFNSFVIFSLLSQASVSAALLVTSTLYMLILTFCLSDQYFRL